MRRRSSPYHQRDLHCDIGRDHLAGAYMDLSAVPLSPRRKAQAELASPSRVPRGRGQVHSSPWR